MWNLPWPGIEPVFPSLADRFSSTVPPGKSERGKLFKGVDLLGPDAGKYWGQEKRVTEDEMAGWHHQLNVHELGQTLGDSEGQGGLVCYSPRGRTVGHDLATKQWTTRVFTKNFSLSQAQTLSLVLAHLLPADLDSFSLFLACENFSFLPTSSAINCKNNFLFYFIQKIFLLA